MKIVIEIDEARFKDIRRIAWVQLEKYHFKTVEQIIANGTPLPSIESERKTGEWIEHEWAEETYQGYLVSNYECDQCHEWVMNQSNYCPNCGAKMGVNADADSN